MLLTITRSDTVVLLTNNQVQCIGDMQQFIDEATTVSKKCIYNLAFTGKPFRTRYEQGATGCVEATA